MSHELIKCVKCGKVDSECYMYHTKQGPLCNDCSKNERSHYERTRQQVYATGNKWAIENFHATHD